MKNISETQTLSTIHLSDTQKTVLSKIIGSATPETALEEISDGRNMVAARDILHKLDLIVVTDRDAAVSEEGKEVMRDENLIDDTDQLTQDGQQYSQADSPEDLKDVEDGMADPAINGPEDPAAMDDEMGGEELPPEDDLSLESKIPMISGMNNLLCESVLLENVNRKFSPQEVKAMESGNDLPDDLMDKIFEFVVDRDSTWMPYGTQKARDGDPHIWITDHMSSIVSAIKKN